MLADFDHHARPFVLGMNGTSAGFFIPQEILLDPAQFAQPVSTDPSPPAGVTGGVVTQPVFADPSPLARVTGDLIAQVLQSFSSFNGPVDLPDGRHLFNAPDLFFDAPSAPQSAPLADIDAFDLEPFRWEAPALHDYGAGDWTFAAGASMFDQPLLGSSAWDFFLY